MGAGAVKAIVVLLFLAALGFVAGSLAADGAKQVLIPMGLLVGAVGLLCLGKHCWVLVFVLPPVFSLLDISLLASFPVAYLMAGVLLVYWLLMYVMGYVRITWHSVPVLDVINLVFILYFLSTWLRHPVTINALVNPITDSGYAVVGGKEYIWCVAAACCYIFMSIIPLDTKTIGRLLKVVFWVSLVLIFFTTVKNLIFKSPTPVGGVQFEAEEVERDFSYYNIAKTLYGYLLCKYSFLGIVCSPWKIALLVGSLFAIAMSGFRSNLMRAGLTMLLTQYVHRQLLLVIFPCLIGYGALLYFSTDRGIMDVLPKGIKRVMTAFPGVEIDDKGLARAAQNSLDWRYEMWEWALNPNMGYIKDYVWGDGFGLSSYVHRMQRININRRKIFWGDNRIFAQNGVWHSGYITAIHRTGYVGLALVIVWCVIFALFALRLCVNIRDVSNREYYLYYILPVVPETLMFFISAGTYNAIFNMFFTMALTKVVYSLAIKEGYMRPMFEKNRYLPIMLQEIEQRGDAVKQV